MTVQFRTHENGGVCCSSINAAGERVAPEYPCDACKAHFAAIGLRENLKTQEDIATKNDNCIPLDSYAEGLKRLRAASETPASTFEARWKNERLGALAAEYAELDAHIAATPQARLTAAQMANLEQYAAPDPYASGIRKLQEDMKR